MPFNRETIMNCSFCLSNNSHPLPSCHFCLDGLIMQLEVGLKCIYIHVRRVSYD